VRHGGLALGALISISLASCLLPELTKRANDDGEGNAGTSSNGGKNSGAGSDPGGGSSNQPQGGDGGEGAATAGTAASSSGSSSGGTPSGGSAPGGSSNGGNAGTTGDGGAGGEGNPPLTNFSFFVTSMAAMQELSGSQDGFGGDLRYGQVNGLAGADKICSEIADMSMPGASAKEWRAFLSTANPQVHAVDRIGQGPWYDRLGRLVAADLQDLINTRPEGADPAIVNDLPNEDGVPNHRPDPGQPEVDNPAVLTGSSSAGHAMSASSTCGDWTISVDNDTNPRVGMAWAGAQNQNWISAYAEGGCAPGGTLLMAGGPPAGDGRVGAGGGYGAIYCFALEP
jgi:hypothetical protein